MSAPTGSATSSLTKHGLASCVQDHLWYGAAVKPCVTLLRKQLCFEKLCLGPEPYAQELCFSSGPCSLPELCGRYPCAQPCILLSLTLPCWCDLQCEPHHYRHFWWSLSAELLLCSSCSGALLSSPYPWGSCPDIILSPLPAFPCVAACSCCSLTRNLVQITFSLIPWPKCFYYMCSSKLSKVKLLCWKIGCIPLSSSELNCPHLSVRVIFEEELPVEFSPSRSSFCAPKPYQEVTKTGKCKWDFLQNCTKPLSYSALVIQNAPAKHID